VLIDYITLVFATETLTVSSPRETSDFGTALQTAPDIN